MEGQNLNRMLLSEIFLPYRFRRLQVEGRTIASENTSVFNRNDKLEAYPTMWRVVRESDLSQICRLAKKSGKELF